MAHLVERGTGYLRRHGVRGADAEDMAVEVYEDLLMKYGAGFSIALFWTALRHRCVDAAKTGTHRRLREESAALREEAPAVCSPLEAEETRSLVGLVIRRMEECGESDLLLAVEVHHLEGRSVVETGRCLGWSRRTTHRRIRDGLEALARGLRAEPGVLEGPDDSLAQALGAVLRSRARPSGGIRRSPWHTLESASSISMAGHDGSVAGARARTGP
jgi:DNA-directed RNA polymerase specialized sigma24 family protein